jgi:hypothetical protein
MFLIGNSSDQRCLNLTLGKPVNYQALTLGPALSWYRRIRSLPIKPPGFLKEKDRQKAKKTDYTAKRQTETVKIVALTPCPRLKSKFSTSKRGGKVKIPKAFPEKGLYMLAANLKSSQAIQAALAIIETFSKMRKLTRNIKTLSNVKDKHEQQA